MKIGHISAASSPNEKWFKRTNIALKVKVDNIGIIKRIEQDKEGLIKQGNELREGITELQRRLLMVQGALKYVNQILRLEETDERKETGSNPEV